MTSHALLFVPKQFRYLYLWLSQIHINVTTPRGPFHLYEIGYKAPFFPSIGPPGTCTSPLFGTALQSRSTVTWLHTHSILLHSSININAWTSRSYRLIFLISYMLAFSFYQLNILILIPVILSWTSPIHCFLKFHLYSCTKTERGDFPKNTLQFEILLGLAREGTKIVEIRTQESHNVNLLQSFHMYSYSVH